MRESPRSATFTGGKGVVQAIEIAFVAKAGDADAPERVARAGVTTAAFQALEQVGMTEFARRQIGALSGGQRRRVFLARAIASALARAPYLAVAEMTGSAAAGRIDRGHGPGRDQAQRQIGQPDAQLQRLQARSEAFEARRFLGLRTQQRGVALVGDIPRGLPTVSVPDTSVRLAGVETGDIVLAVADERPKSLGDLWKRIWGLGSAGVEIPIVVERDNRILSIRIPSVDRLLFTRAPVLH